MLLTDFIQRAYLFLSEPMIEVVHCSNAKEEELDQWSIASQPNRLGTWVDENGQFVAKDGQCSSLRRDTAEKQYLVIECRPAV